MESGLPGNFRFHKSLLDRKDSIKPSQKQKKLNNIYESINKNITHTHLH